MIWGAFVICSLKIRPDHPSLIFKVSFYAELSAIYFDYNMKH